MAAEPDEPRRTIVHEIGQDLSTLGIDELDARMDLLRAEIDRLADARRAKTASRAAADAVFKFS